MSKLVLLTGATGFLGSHLLKGLIKANYKVVIVVRETSDNWRIIDYIGYSTFVLNSTGSNIGTVFELHKIDIIIHVATEYGRKLPYSSVLESNVIFPIKLIEFAIINKVELFVNTDSFLAKFEDCSYLAQYAESKRILNNYTKLLEKIKVVNLRLEHLYGEFDSDTKFITNVMNKMLRNEQVIEFTEGLQRRDFIYVLDAVDAYLVIIKELNSLDNYTEFEVGNGISITIKEIVLKMQIACSSNSELLFGVLETRINEIEDSKANNLPLINLGWKPKYNVDTALKRIVKTEKNKFLNL